jgi:hypothetical protein
MTGATPRGVARVQAPAAAMRRRMLGHDRLEGSDCSAENAVLMAKFL